MGLFDSNDDLPERWRRFGNYPLLSPAEEARIAELVKRAVG